MSYKEKKLFQAMSHQEREHLKHSIGYFDGQEKEVITMIAHWMRQPIKIEFSLYAANWAAAQKRKDVSRLQKVWPLETKRMIADNCSDWGSFSTIPGGYP